MDKGALLNRVASSPEERIMLARVLDKYEQMERRCLPTASGFLSPAEQAAAQRLMNAAGLGDALRWNGGYPEAERRQARFYPEWAEEDSAGIACVRALFRGDGAPNHRDILGSLMGLGLTREKIGDILVDEEGCSVLAAEDILPFLLQNWSSAGRVHLSVSAIALEELVVPQQRTREIRDTVMSLRLDAVAASGFSISRARAAELIAAGRVQLNHTDCLKGDRAVAQGDVITARGLGKCVLREVGGLSRKGRTVILVERYL